MDTEIVKHVMKLRESYRRWVGRELCPEAQGLEPRKVAQRIFEAPLCIVSHGVEAEPLFNYANLSALTLFEMSREQFIGLPSRLSAEPHEREARAHFMQRVAERGFVDDYCGVRVSARGRRFRLENATVWNVSDPSGRRVGQAAAFSRWTFLDGR